MKEQSSIVFSIKEAVWFNRGNEVDELYSLALEPDISIHEEDDYVFIRGNLHLFGEYRPKEDDVSIGEERRSEQGAFRAVDEVIMKDDGIGMIRHSFPMDVTIPRERVAKLEDVYVTVDSFDYELPQQECIQLEANVSIAGIQEDRHDVRDDFEELEQTIVAEDVVEEEKSSLPAENEDTERTFHIEQYNRPQEEIEEVEESKTASFIEEEILKTHDDEEYEREAAPLEIEEETFVEDTEPELVEPAVHFLASKKEEIHSFYEKNVGNIEDRDEELADSEPESDDVDNENDIEEENALYLTKMLVKGEEEFSKLKMCIVQTGETLEMISKRYDIQVSQLIRVNRLTEEEISEGQILYIPADRTK